MPGAVAKADRGPQHTKKRGQTHTVVICHRLGDRGAGRRAGLDARARSQQTCPGGAEVEH